ncbi:MAG: cyclic nucleotide-binding domain-containing protein [Proteobacteria bacterium]|nr:cyclic nucleotide-binding domain-containing protein [Pseudomonadota bacterium]MBU1233792.1 cyclic nucleotide-binding domain-containing protein [Pseudomonadota bacterium]MBU1416970.1 cyclic nucleotide-binding domain-containing protein [Pseudomonadota bacterium]MBU1454681.1 cyclic nucleotide-binding domain-containing protein [Pseudomonadota bacterium]
MGLEPKKLTESEEETRDFLFNLPLFDSFNVDELTILAKHMSFIHLQRGEFLFVEGDKGDFMGFVVHGILEVLKKSATGENIVIARLTKGSSIGEMALIDKSPRSATVVSRQPTTMVTLTSKGFDRLTEKSPLLGVKVIQKTARLLSLNMRRTSSKLADMLQTNS